eukprot:12133162-Karenia_brevis.AAC.1
MIIGVLTAVVSKKGMSTKPKLFFNKQHSLLIRFVFCDEGGDGAELGGERVPNSTDKSDGGMITEP